MTAPARVRVGYDVTALLAGDTGVARYVRELAAAIDRRRIDQVGQGDPGDQVELVRYAIGRGAHTVALPNETRRVRLPLRLVHRSWVVSGRPRAERLAPRCDVVHVPDLVPPPTGNPLVLTIHDLVALEYPALHPPRSTAVQARQLAAARVRAQVVLAVSHATAATLRSHGVDAERIVVAPNGVTRLPPPDRSIVPRAPFLLAVGSLTPRKGFDTLIAAFAGARLPRAVRLVIAGSVGWGGADVFAAIERHGMTGRVTCTGRVSDAQLAALYAGCIAVCVPSVAEGFGLPILEAAAAGAPVIASDLAVFHEVADGAVRYVPVGNRDEWAAALERIVADGGLRRELSARGRLVAREYTWERTARITVAAYERARRAA